MFSAHDIDIMIASPKENENLEFKEAKEQYDSEKLYKYCVALANEGGGHLLLGITDKTPRQVVGSKAFSDLQKTKEQIFSKVRFRVDIEEIMHPDGRVVVFSMPSRPQGTLYNYEGAYLMRVGESLRPMTEDMLRRIFDEGKGDFLLRPACKDVSADEVISLLDVQGFFDLEKRPYPSSQESVLERLATEQLITKHSFGYNITNLGALLFAKDLQLFKSLRRKRARVVIYEGINKFTTKHEYMENKGYAVGFESLVAYINSQIPTNEVIEEALRKEIRMYPELAIRELVANALVHQDLEDLSTLITVEIYADRVEISNPGIPLIPTDRFIDEYKARNERLTDIMRRLGICEERSSGIDKVIFLSELWQLPAPDFHTSEHRTCIMLYAHKSFEEMNRNERIRACYQHACLCLVNNKKMSNQSLRERFKLPDSKAETASRIIADAVAAGRIKIDDAESSSRRYAKYVPYWA